MANNAEVVLKFKVAEDGSLTLVTKNIDKASKAAKGLADSQKQAGKAADEHNYKLNQGVTGVSSASRSFSKLSQAIGSGPNGLVGAYATLAANAFAVSAAFNSLRAASQAEAVLRGLEVQGARTGITLTNTAKSIQEISRNSLSMTDSMQAAAQASAAGFSTKDIENLTIAAQNASIALGRNMPDSLDRIIKGTTKLEPELLDELGIMVKLTEANNKYALANNKTANSLTSFEKRQAFLNAVVEESTLKFGGLADEVEANPYDKLAASFTNLTKDTYNFINNTAGVGSVINYLAENTSALIGVLIMFAGTISRQLVPGLYQMSEAALNANEKIKASIELKRKNIKATLDQAAAEKKATLTALRNLPVQEKSPEGYTEYVKALKEGNASEEQRARALRSINASIISHNNLVLKMADSESKAAITKKELVKDLEKQRDALIALNQAEQNASSITTKAEAEARNLRNQAVGEKLKGAAQVSRASAIEAAAAFEPVNAYREARKSTALYERGLTRVAEAKMQAAQGGGIFTRTLATVSASSVGARTAIFALGTGVRALGAAFLNAIPFIGQLIMAFQLLKEAYNYVKEIFFPDPAGTKELNKALEVHKEILSTIEDTAKQSNKIFSNTGRTSSQITQGLTIVSNKVNEVVDSYTEVEAKTRALGNEVAKQLANPEKSISIVSGKTAKEEAKLAIESLSALRTLGYAPLVRDIDEAITTNEKFWNASGADQVDIASKLLKRLQVAYGELDQATKNLDQNYKKLSESYDAFIKSATIKTPFDELVKNWDEQAVEIKKLDQALKEGTISLEDYGKKINQIRDNSTVYFVDEKTIKQLSYIRELERYRAEQQKIYDSESIGRGVEQYKVARNIEAASYRIAEAEGQLATFSKEAQLSARQRLIDLQKAFILNQGELKIVQARLQSTADIQSAGEEGLRLRLKLEEKSRAIQIESLKVQKSLIETRIASSEVQLKFEQDSLDRQAQGLLIEKQKTAETLKRAAIEKGVSIDLLQKDAARIRERGAGNAGNSEQVKAQSEYLKSLEVVDAAEQDLKNRASQRALAEEALNVSNREARLAVLSIDKEIQAINEQNLSAGKKEALISQARLNRIAKEREEQSNIIDQTLALQEVERKRAVLLAGNAESFSEEIRGIKEAANADRRRILNSYEAQRLRLLGEIQVAEQNVLEATAEESKAAQETLAAAKNRLAVLDTTTEVTLRQKDAEADLALQTKLYVDTRKLGLELQQQSLEYLQRELDLAAELSKTRLATSQINREISLKNRGLYKTEEQQQAFEIEVAKQAYEIAVKEAALKKSLIDLEFALLDGQREILKQQLMERKAEMLSAGYSTEDTAIKQLTASIDNISKAPPGYELAIKAKEQVDANIEQLGKSLLNIITRGGSPDDPVAKMLSTIEGIENRRIAKQEARDALNKPKPQDPLAKAVIDSGDKQIKAASIGVARSNELLEQIVANTTRDATTSRADSKVDVQSRAVGTILGTDDPKIMARKVADYVASDSRVRVSEIGGYGSIGGHKKGSMHYSNRAFDLNVPGIGNEASNAGAKAILDQKAIEISRTGMEVLWNGMIYRMGQAVAKIPATEGQHTDHLHAEVDESSYRLMKKMYSSMGQAAVSGAKRASEEASSSTIDEAITVTGARSNSIIGEDKPLYSGVDLSGLMQSLPPLPDITQYSNTNWDGIRDKIEEVSAVVDSYSEKLKALGPDGEVAAALAQGAVKFADTWTVALQRMDTVGASTGDKIKAVASAISASIGVIQSVTAAASDAKIAGIDKEIAAEQKRDGKSAQSLAKLDAMEKKKDNIARKQFNLNKKLMIAQAVMSTAAGIAGALASPPVGPWNIALAAMIGAMGLAQVAIISGTQYESSYSPKTPSMPTSLSIGKRSDTVDLARGPNVSAGGEVGYLRGYEGTGANASNYRTVGSAYGGDLMRGYGNRGFVVGEKGPEVISPETPVNVTPANEVNGNAPVNATINIQAIDSQGVQDVLVAQKGNIIQMLREAANSSGQRFLEDVNVNVYTRPNVGRL